MCLLIVVAPFCSTFSIYLKIKFEAENTSCDARWFSLPFQAFLRPWWNCTFYAEKRNDECSPQFIIAIIIMQLHFMSKGKSICSIKFFCSVWQRSFMRWCHDQMIGFSCSLFKFLSKDKKLNKLAEDLRLYTHRSTKNTSAWLKFVSRFELTKFFYFSSLLISKFLRWRKFWNFSFKNFGF